MWSAYLFQTATGNIGPRLKYSNLSWSMQLNGTESISLDLRKSDLPNVDLTYWLAAWWAGVVLLWDGTPIVAGPILTRPNETIDRVSINCGGIRSVLANRVVAGEFANWDDLPKSTLSYAGLSLGTIAAKVVQQVQMKPSGHLPITFPQPDETSAIADDADHQRTYEGFNVQNLLCDDVLTKLSNVLDGPDIMFKPRMLSPSQLTFDMWHGTEAQPRIYQTDTKVWDTNPVMGQVADVSIVYTGSYEASRVYSLGAGSDQGLLITVSTNDVPLQKQFPLLEKVINIGSSDNPVIVRNHGEANLAANEEALLEIQMTVRGDTEIPFGRFWPGDLAHIITKGWLSLPDGDTPMRILSMTGDNTSNVKVSLQKESKFVKQ